MISATFNDPCLQSTFERDGYVVVPDLLDAAEVAELRAAYERLGPAPGDPGVGCHFSFQSDAPAYKAAADEAIRRVLLPRVDQSLSGHRAYYANFIMKWPGDQSGFALHQDLSFVDEREFSSMSVWVSTVDTTRRNGALHFVPGSHRIVPTVRPSNQFRFAFTGLEDHLVSRYSRPEPVAAGTAIVFDHRVLHFSDPNATPEPRLALNIGLVPEHAPLRHYHGYGDGRMEAFEVDERFFVDNDPFTLQQRPTGVRTLGEFEFHPPPLDVATIDAWFAAQGRRRRPWRQRRSAVVNAEPWCHRCGTTDGLPTGHSGRRTGNVAVLCERCRARTA